MLGLFTFIATWTNFFWPFIVLEPGNPTLPVALQQLQAAYVDYSLVLAGVVLAAIPLLIVFVLAGRQLVSGIMQGAVGMTLNLTSSGRHAKPVAGEQDSTAGTRKVPDGFVLGVATAAYQIEGPATRTGAPTRSGTPSRTARARLSTATPAISRATTTTATPAMSR